jgi:ribulose-phosphate 3-epimerase
MIAERKARTIIEVDGGVNDVNIRKLEEAGATAFVAGSFVFGAKNPGEVISRLKNV